MHSMDIVIHNKYEENHSELHDKTEEDILIDIGSGKENTDQDENKYCVICTEEKTILYPMCTQCKNLYICCKCLPTYIKDKKKCPQCSKELNYTLVEHTVSKYNIYKFMYSVINVIFIVIWITIGIFAILKSITIHNNINNIVHKYYDICEDEFRNKNITKERNKNCFNADDIYYMNLLVIILPKILLLLIELIHLYSYISYTFFHINEYGVYHTQNQLDKTFYMDLYGICGIGKYDPQYERNMIYFCKIRKK